MRNSGSGFVVKLPNGVKVAITNAHVIEDGMAGQGRSEQAVRVVLLSI